MVDKPKQYKPNRNVGAKKFRHKTESASSKGYDSVWRTYRFRFLHHNPKCYACGLQAGVVDHIVTHKGDEELFKKLDNHMPLCTYCHNFITGKFDGKKIQDLEGKLKWLKKRREELKVVVRIKPLSVYEKKK